MGVPLLAPPSVLRLPKCAAAPLLAIAAALLVAGCANRNDPPHVVLISIDTLRADHLGTYGYSRDTSPHLDALAREGVVFENAVSSSTWTLPSHATMLTGVSPYRHGAVSPATRVRDDVPLVAERLRARGYETLAFVNAPFVGARHGFDRGFDVFVEHSKRPRDPVAYRQMVLDGVRAPRSRPAFFFIHYMDVHSPYRPPAEYNRFADGRDQASVMEARGMPGAALLELARAVAAGKAQLTDGERQLLIDLYDGEILAMDAKIAELVQALRTALGPNTLIFVTSDHGEEFLEHGGLLHGRTLYEELLRVPLIVVGPGVKPTGRVRELAWLADLVPTILDLTGAPAPDLEGRSLRRLLAGEEPDGEPPRLALHTRAADQSVDLRGVRLPRSKLILDAQSRTSAYFDLGADPDERRELAPPAELSRIGEQIGQLAVAPSTTEPRAPAPETVEALKALDYL